MFTLEEFFAVVGKVVLIAFFSFLLVVFSDWLAEKCGFKRKR